MVAVITLLASFYLLALVVLGWQAFRRGNGVEFLPSAAWAVLMVLPLAGQAEIFVEDAVLPQTIGIFWFAFLILVSDAMAPFARNQPTRIFSDRFWRNTAYVGVATVMVLWGLHISFMPKIPLVEKYLHGVTDVDKLGMLREESSKLLRVPALFIFGCQIGSQILAPVLTLIFLRQRRYLAAGFLISLALLYSRITLAKGPIYTLSALVLLLICKGLWHNRARRHYLLVLPVVGAMALGAATKVLLFDPISPYLYQVEDKEALGKLEVSENELGLSVTPADRYRLLVRQHRWLDAPLWKQNITYFYYRVLLVPVEVSHRWYGFYPDVSRGFLGSYGYTPESREAVGFQHPSNTIALWAYRQRFPAQYSDTTHAYASIDADAYAHWGYAGLFFIGSLMFGMRLLLSWLRTNEAYGDLFYYAGIFVLAISLPVASIFALMAAQGVLFCFLILGLLRMCWFIKTTKNAASSASGGQVPA